MYNPFFPDNDGMHRRPEHRYWKYIYPISVDPERIKRGDILLTRAKSVSSAGIIYFSGTDTVRAWLSHCGQILENNIVSEASYPYHKLTPLSDYLALEKENKVRLTVVRLKDSVYPDIEVKRRALMACERYHLSLGHYPSMRDYLKSHGHPYNAIGLTPMLAMSILRNTLPFLKKGKWHNIPKEYEAVIFICSGIVKWGFAWLMREIKVDLFPSSLSRMIPSPQDIYDSPYTEYVCGWKKEYLG